MKFHYKRWLLVANDLTNILLRRERVQLDKRVNQLTRLLIGLIALLIISVGVNVYLVLRLTGV